MASTRSEQRTGARVQVAKERAATRAPGGAPRAKRVDWSGFSDKVKPPSPPRNRNTTNPFDDDYVGDENLLAEEEKDRHKLRITEDTTEALKRIQKVAHDTRAVGEETLVTLHAQGEQIRRTHEKVVVVDKELSKSEQLLNKLGGIFEYTWKPKKTKKIEGPQDFGESRGVLHERNNSEANSQARAQLLKQKSARMKPGDGESFSDSETPSQRVEKSSRERFDEHRAAQDHVLDDVSSTLAAIKVLGLEMNQELDRQAPGVENLGHDIDELNSRVGQAKQRGAKLLGRKMWW